MAIAALAALACRAPAPAQEPLVRRGTATDVAWADDLTLRLELDRVYKRDLQSSSVSGVRTDARGAFVSSLSPTTSARGMELEYEVLLLRLAHGWVGDDAEAFALEGFVQVGFVDSVLEAGILQPGRREDGIFVDGRGGLAYGAGIRSRLFRRDGWRVLADASVLLGSHGSAVSQKDNLGLEIDDEAVPPESATQDFDTELLIWELSALVATDLQAGRTVVAPYAGVRVSRVEYELDGSQSFFNPGFNGTQTVALHSDEKALIGFLAGLDVAFAADAGAYFELHLVDGIALSLGAELRF